MKLDFFELLYKHLNVNILCIAYRGYSDSEGSPNEEGLKKDIDVWLKT